MSPRVGSRSLRPQALVPSAAHRDQHRNTWRKVPNEGLEPDQKRESQSYHEVFSDYLILSSYQFFWAEFVFQFKLDVHLRGRKIEVTSSLSTRRCSANPQADPVAMTMQLAFLSFANDAVFL